MGVLGVLGSCIGELLSLVAAFLSGLADGLSVHKSTHAFRSPVVREKTLLVVLLNGVIFVGSDFVFSRLIFPFFSDASVRDGDAADGSSDAGLGSIVDIAGWAYLLLWAVPVWFISIVLSGIWYAEIAEHSYAVYFGRKRGAASSRASASLERLVKTVTDSIFCLFLIGGGLLLQGVALSKVPWLGRTFELVNGAWIVSWYAFDSLWVLKGWSLERKVTFFESKWAYFAGFGAPVAAASVAFPGLVSAGVWSLLFPPFIITATYATPRGVAETLLPAGQRHPPSSSHRPGPASAPTAGDAGPPADARTPPAPSLEQQSKQQHQLQQPADQQQQQRRRDRESGGGNILVPERVSILRLPRAIANVLVRYLFPAGRILRALGSMVGPLFLNKKKG